ncbi:MAG TPA: DNA polymerase III subunit delta', partial [Firmicutes bacterium]|nr:DNA polymerase III subunit delta' [Bacillota bacterium]
FLKLLEEPPAGTHFILSTGQAARLQPTILSRCQILKIDRLGIAELGAA